MPTDNETNLFLTYLFGSKPPESYILIWTKKGNNPATAVKESHWFQNIDDAAEFASSNIDRDVYFGVAMSPKDYGINRRCVKGETAGIAGLWIDIDIADGIHAKPNLPATIDEAVALLYEFELGMPSIVIHSGGGIQAYFLFPELWIFDGAGRRTRAAQLAERFNYYFKKLADAHGWDLDSTFDLARVMRLPGTWNCKATEPRPVKILEFNDNVYYLPDELEDFLDEQGIELQQKKTTAVNTATGEILPPTSSAANLQFVLNPAASFNADLFDGFAEIEPKFAKSWNHKRKDIQDQSCSSYDLSLAALTINANWPIQEVVNLLIHHRRKYGDPKLDNRGNLRRDYYERTITRALQNIGRAELEIETAFDEQASEDKLQFDAVDLQVADEPVPAPDPVDSSDAADLEETDETPAAPDPKRNGILNQISNQLGVKIVNIARVLADPPYFRLDLEKQKIDLGDAGGIIDPKKFRVKVATAALILIPDYSSKNKKASWEQIAGALIAAAVDEAPDPTETPAGFVEHWLYKYLTNYTVVDWQAPEVHDDLPFVYKGFKYVDLQHFTNYLKLNQVGLKSYSEALRQLGAIRESRQVPKPANGEGYTTKSRWRLPERF